MRRQRRLKHSLFIALHTLHIRNDFAEHLACWQLNVCRFYRLAAFQPPDKIRHADCKFHRLLNSRFNKLNVAFVDNFIRNRTQRNIVRYRQVRQLIINVRTFHRRLNRYEHYIK